MPNCSNRSRRSGFTLVEIMVAMSTVALLTAVALPKTEGLFAHLAVKAARGDLAGKFRLAQLSATVGGRSATVRVAFGRAWVEARPRGVPLPGSTADTLGGVTDFAMVHKVSMTSTLDSVVYTPNGFAAAGGVVVVHRNGISDSITVNALGLVVQ